jgi:hypothetical protein
LCILYIEVDEGSMANLSTTSKMGRGKASNRYCIRKTIRIPALTMLSNLRTVICITMIDKCSACTACKSPNSFHMIAGSG